MGLLKTPLKSIKIVQNTAATDLLVDASWAAATDLGNLKGKPWAKVTWDDDTVDSQAGKNPLQMTAKMETSTLEVGDSTVATAVEAMRGKNVSLQCTPLGTVGVGNPIVIIKNFILCLGGEINIGDVSFLKMSGEKPAAALADIYALDTTVGA